MRLRKLLHIARKALRFFPIGVRSFVPKWRTHTIYRGDYKTWATAKFASGGYDDEMILEKAVEATRAVRDGKAVWERDTVLFYEPASHEPLMAALFKVISESGGRLSVLDFGGALGSTWWQHRKWLNDFAEVRWSVVEQATFVEAGRKEFENGPLRFYHTVDECVMAERPNVVLLSAVLPYLERPHALLADVAVRDINYLIIDRNGFTDKGRDWLTVQHVPPSIYAASYPCWFFDRESLLAPLMSEWKVVAEWLTFDEPGAGYEYRGLMLQRINRLDSHL
jgi:putative methyltransferase (TIGR04325 family)